VGLAWSSYASEWKGYLPGTSTDVDIRGKTFCWLGVGPDAGGDNDKVVPFRGTIFKYMGQQVNAYKCPEDKLVKNASQNGSARQKVLYSYTAPSTLSGAPIHLLRSTMWPKEIKSGYQWDKDWKAVAIRSVPWMVVEEHESWYLNFATDANWCNDDSISNRHRGKGSIARTDGSVSNRAYPRQVVPTMSSPFMIAWMVLFDLTDKRVVTAGTMADVQADSNNYYGGAWCHFGYMHRAPSVGW
jgi:hypothetical protein